MQPQQVNLTPQQVQLAASAGVELLDIKDLAVPMSLAMGQLGVLKTLLQAVLNGDLIFSLPPPKAMSEDPPKLKAVEGDKP
jgi:hypothetical protein